MANKRLGNEDSKYMWVLRKQEKFLECILQNKAGHLMVFTERNILVIC